MKQSLLNRISEHVYWLDPDASTDRPTLGAVVGRQATVIVDAGNSPAHANLLLSELAKLELTKPRYLVLTHWHWDHVFGVSAFDAPIVAHNETRRAMKAMTGLDWSDEALDRRVEEGTEIEFCRDMIKAEWPDRSNLRFKLPDLSFATQLEFDLGGVRCQVKHVGGDHASDSSIVYVPEDCIVFLSDCLYEDLHHGPRNYTTKKLFPLIDEIVSYNADYYVWGHNLEPMPNTEMKEFAQLLRSIGEHVEQTGDNREFILYALQGTSSKDLDDDSLEILDAFLAGLRNKELMET